MPKRRMIHEKLCTSRNNLTWTFRQRFLFVGLIANADDQGRLEGHPALVRAAVFPYDEISHDEIRADLDALAAQQVILLYNAGGHDYIQIIHWWEYQQPQWATPSLLPAPDSWRDRIRYRLQGMVLTYNWTTPQGNSALDTCDIKGRALGNALPKDSPELQGKALASRDSDSIAIDKHSGSDNVNEPPPVSAPFALPSSLSINLMALFGGKIPPPVHEAWIRHPNEQAHWRAYDETQKADHPNPEYYLQCLNTALNSKQKARASPRQETASDQLRRVLREHPELDTRNNPNGTERDNPT